MDDLAQFKQTFFAECEELLGDMEGHLMALQSGEGDNNTLHAVFRAIHSIKGGAGAFGFDRLIMLLAGRSNLRDTIAFPKTASATDPLTDAPSAVSDKQLEELSIRVALKPPTSK